MTLEKLVMTCAHLAWVIAAIAGIAVVCYETWHPCGLRSMDKDVIAWIKRCER